MESLLISLLVFALVAGLLYWLITLLPLPAPFKTIAMVVFVVICIIWVLQFLPGTGFHFGR